MFGLSQAAEGKQADEVLGKAVVVSIWHKAVMRVFLSFTAVHVYLVLTEDIRQVKAMVDGYYFRYGTEKAKG